MRMLGGGGYVLRHVWLCILLLCGCRMFNAGSIGPVDVVLREGWAGPEWKPSTETCQGAELLLPRREAVPNCILEGRWPKSLSSSEIKIATEELVDLYWRCNYFDFVRKGQNVERPVVVCKLGTGLHDTRVRISGKAVPVNSSGGEETSVLPFQSGFAAFTLYKDKPLVVFNPVIARLEDVLAMIYENYGVRYGVRDGKIVIVPSRIGNGSHFGNEYEDMAKALMAKCREHRLPYEEGIMVRWWNVFDKSRQEEYANAKNGVVFPLGCHSREDIVENRGDVPASFIGRLKVSLAGDRKCLLHTVRGGDRVLCSIDPSAYAVLSVRMENVDTDREAVSVKQLPPSIEMPERNVPEGEMLLVFTPQGLFARPWYSRQFSLVITGTGAVSQNRINQL